MPFAFEKGPAKTGQDITITCTVSEGDLPLGIRWLLNGNPVESYRSINSAKFGKRNMVLSIESVTAIIPETTRVKRAIKRELLAMQRIYKFMVQEGDLEKICRD